MSCRRFDDLLQASIGRALDAGEQAEFDAHLGDCPSCVAHLKDYVVTVQVLQGFAELEAVQPAAPVPENLVQRILVARRAETTRTRDTKSA